MSIVGVNAGHYLGEDNYDPGACNEVLGLKEADINVSVANKVINLLQERGHETVYIHAGELWEITDASDAAGADVFVSIHCNSAAAEGANGVETFHYTGSPNGKKLASLVQTNLVAELGLKDRGVKDASFYVIRKTEAVAILVELGFLSNMSEGQLMNTEEFQDNAALAIANGIEQYLS